MVRRATQEGGDENESAGSLMSNQIHAASGWFNEAAIKVEIDASHAIKSVTRSSFTFTSITLFVMPCS